MADATNSGRTELALRSGVEPFLLASGPRDRRYPLGAHTGAVSASLLLRCGAHPGVASQNSLRSLRSLHSNSCDGSVYEACCARRPQACAPRRPTDRPQQAPPAALNGWVCWSRTPAAALQRRARTGHAAPRWRREAEGSRPRAQRGSLTDSSRMFERRERSERSEFGDGPQDRCSEPGHKQSCGLVVPGERPGLWPGPQGSRRAAPTPSD